MPKLGALLKLVLVLVSALSLAACAALENVANLQNELQRSGYGNVSVHHNTTNGYDTLTVALTSQAAARPITDADVLAVAKIVWETYPEQVDELRIRLNGEPGAISRAELEREFGARAPGLEQGSNDMTTWLLIALGLLVGAGGFVLVLNLVARRRKRKQPPMQKQSPADPPYPTTYTTEPPQT